MHKLDYIRRAPGIGDFNTIVDTVNKIIDRLEKRMEFENVIITREVKDFNFFNWEEVGLPYYSVHTVTSIEDASEVFKKYALTYKEMNAISKAIEEGKIVSLTIDVKEQITEKEKKQEAVFETVETINMADPEIKVVLPKEGKKKRWRKKKNSWATV